jgi:decaprenyl-phosphate phosphoribosyltransferase
VLVFAAPVAGHQLFQGDVLLRAAGTAVCFTLASIATYFANDLLDRHHDQQHPTKRNRPIAAGHINVISAVLITIACLALSLTSAWFIEERLVSVLALYITITLSYGLWLKHIAVVEMACVAAGFVVRMIAGGVATGIEVSQWFLAVGCFGSLFIVAGKRYAEVREMGEGNVASRQVLASYNTNYLRNICMMSMTVAIGLYFQWTFAGHDGGDHPIWYQLSAVPWVTALLRYGLLLETGHGSAPEDVLLKDRTLLVLGIAWIVVFGIAVYG